MLARPGTSALPTPAENAGRVNGGSRHAVAVVVSAMLHEQARAGAAGRSDERTRQMPFLNNLNFLWGETLFGQINWTCPYRP